MKPDWYTKAVLTVIALSLASIALRPTFPAAVVHAQSLPPRVQVELVGLQGESLAIGGIPVKLQGGSVPVKVEAGIGSIPVRVEAGTGPIPVRIDQPFSGTVPVDVRMSPLSPALPVEVRGSVSTITSVSEKSGGGTRQAGEKSGTKKEAPKKQ